eukprot:CAMPEP_0206501440 /NCGR_PEP_ID=MMETSP0324_2-20121206/53318_1 /ASSEMBLY_ACC=CAM_ASM_000836 /TAXON_ID=2866 /ORGANISM="Crypthecodinium cohnii, Strain Seligo" /LENGTH=742 /DNA_ID=CAMNT_0053989273 /DNA_START=22 /DNA_END=2250 /DNA_ORIENTATION=+
MKARRNPRRNWLLPVAFLLMAVAASSSLEKDSWQNVKGNCELQGPCLRTIPQTDDWIPAECSAQVMYSGILTVHFPGGVSGLSSVRIGNNTVDRESKGKEVAKPTHNARAGDEVRWESLTSGVEDISLCWQEAPAPGRSPMEFFTPSWHKLIFVCVVTAIVWFAATKSCWSKCPGQKWNSRSQLEPLLGDEEHLEASVDPRSHTSPADAQGQERDLESGGQAIVESDDHLTQNPPEKEEFSETEPAICAAHGDSSPAPVENGSAGEIKPMVCLPQEGPTEQDRDDRDVIPAEVAGFEAASEAAAEAEATMSASPICQTMAVPKDTHSHPAPSDPSDLLQESCPGDTKPMLCLPARDACVLAAAGSQASPTAAASSELSTSQGNFGAAAEATPKATSPVFGTSHPPEATPSSPTPSAAPDLSPERSTNQLQHPDANPPCAGAGVLEACSSQTSPTAADADAGVSCSQEDDSQKSSKAVAEGFPKIASPICGTSQVAEEDIPSPRAPSATSEASFSAGDNETMVSPPKQEESNQTCSDALEAAASQTCPTSAGLLPLRSTELSPALESAVQSGPAAFYLHPPSSSLEDLAVGSQGEEGQGQGEACFLPPLESAASSAAEEVSPTSSEGDVDTSPGSQSSFPMRALQMRYQYSPTESPPASSPGSAAAATATAAVGTSYGNGNDRGHDDDDEYDEDEEDARRAKHQGSVGASASTQAPADTQPDASESSQAGGRDNYFLRRCHES